MEQMVSDFWIVPYQDGITHVKLQRDEGGTVVNIEQPGVKSSTDELQGEQRYKALTQARNIAQAFVDQATAELNAYRT